MSRTTDIVDKIYAETIDVWHHLHQNPELSMKEYNTADYLEKQLQKLTTADRIQRVGETGIWVELKGRKETPGGMDNVIILRGDMDALPIQEENDLPYRSRIPNVMHACGHDLHVSALLGSVRVLEHFLDQISGRIWFFFQPGEEVMQGALTFINDPAIDFSKVKAASAIHVSGALEAGKIMLRHGAVLASADELIITVTGQNGHAAYPNTARDAVVAAANLIVQLQTLISRETSATDPAVLTLGTIHGGTKNNIIAREVRIEGTLRTLNSETRKELHRAIQRVAEGVGLSLRTAIHVEIVKGSEPLINDSKCVGVVGAAAEKLLGGDKIEYSTTPGLAGEDFAYITEKIPGVFTFIGAKDKDGPPAQGHTPQFYTNAEALRTGITVLSGFALEYFGLEY